MHLCEVPKKTAIVPNMSILWRFLLLLTAIGEIVTQGIYVCHNAVEALVHFSSLTLFDKLTFFVIEGSFWY